MMKITRLVTDPWKACSTVLHLWRQFGVPPHHSIADFVRFKRLLDAGHSDFLHGRLWDRRLPMAERLRFLSFRDRISFQFLMNPKRSERAIRDKLVASERLKQFGVAGPEVLAVVAFDGERPAGSDVLSSIDEFSAFLDGDHPDGIVCKPASGTQGRDVHVFIRTDAGGAEHRDGTWWPLDRVWALLDEPPPVAEEIKMSRAWLIERRWPPHRTLSAIHGDTLGCVRMVALRFNNGDIEFLTPTWKIPVGDSGVDNRKRGSLYAAVDLASGRIGPAVLERTMVHYNHHPSTGVSLENIQLPDWSAVIDLAFRAMAPFPDQRSLGFDVGITDEGPRIVEVNSAWSISMMQTAQGVGVVKGAFLRFLEELGCEDVIRREVRGIPPR